MNDRTCKTCRFWAQHPDDGATTGECTMAEEGREKAFHWLAIRAAVDGSRFFGPFDHDQEIAPGVRVRAVLVTGDNFGCVSYESEDLET